MYGKNEQFYVICLYFMSFFWKKNFFFVEIFLLNWIFRFMFCLELYLMGFEVDFELWRGSILGWNIEIHLNISSNEFISFQRGRKTKLFFSQTFFINNFFQFLFLQVRTLFVSGLPMDAKPRELYLLFRAYEGYEGSLLKVTSKNGKTASVSFLSFSFFDWINFLNEN